MKTTITSRVAALRAWMRRVGVDAFITPSTDPHTGEYVPAHWESRKYISGFDGSAGTAVVTASHAALWTDNRYFLHAAEQLEGTPFELQKLGLEHTPTIAAWLAATLGAEQTEAKRTDGEDTACGRQPGACGRQPTVGIDPFCYTSDDAVALMADLAEAGIAVRCTPDPYAEIWPDRPSIPLGEVEVQPLEWAGETAAAKIGRLRDILARRRADALIVPALDEVAWTLNLRGTDVDYTPLFVAYLLVRRESATVYIDERKLTAEARQALREAGVGVKDYGAVIADLEALSGRVLCDTAHTNHRVALALSDRAVRGQCPVSVMKIMKNDTEIAGYHAAMIRDGVAMVQWMRWALDAIRRGGQTELSLSARLHDFRAAQALYRDESFETIMGYGPHAAIVHYEPKPETDVPVEPHGLLLCDSGGQYRDGTTDVTRTLPCGPLTAEERRDYTLCLRGFIRLASVVFPRGTCGTQLDALAREPMWRYGINYLHGTGHGVGSYMSVHEGPHQFRMNHMPQPLVPSMTITCEPGIYIAGSHGVRHENTTLVVPATLRECADSEGRTFGPYYQLEQLTLVPIITSPIVRELMQDEEVRWFNAYQQHVYDTLAPHLDAAHREWLHGVTRPI